MNAHRPASSAYPSARWLPELKRVRRMLARPLVACDADGGQRLIRERDSVLLRLRLDTGGSGDKSAPRKAIHEAGRETICKTSVIVGYGEAAPLPWFGSETAGEAFAALAALGAEIRDIPAALQALGTRTPCARWALECALAQIEAQAEVQAEAQTSPVQTPQPDTPQAQTPIAALLTYDAAASPAAIDAQLAHTLRQALDNGYTTFKLKLGVRLLAEEAQIVRHLLGILEREKDTKTPLRLRLDANGGLSLSDFRSWLSLLKPHAALIDFIEQPLPPGREEETAEAAIGSPLQWALDESLTTFANLKKLAKRYPQAALVLKPSLLGERAAFMRWRLTADNSPRKVIYSTALETGIGLFHALHLACGAPLRPPSAAGFGTAALFADDGLGLPPQTALATTTPLGAPATLNAMQVIWNRA